MNLRSWISTRLEPRIIVLASASSNLTDGQSQRVLEKMKLCFYRSGARVFLTDDH
jgi:hypothetical protein